ncbi:MAG: LPS export ABC transporter permease LptF [Desulfosarcina sp.]
MISPFSILFRHLFTEMMPPFFINMAFFSFIFLMKQILDITDMIVNHKVGVGPVGLMLVYTMPYFLQYIIPMSVMMAVLMAFLRMSSDNEIMALKAGGVSLYRLLTPVLTFSLLGTLIAGYMTLIGVPSGAERFKSLLIKVATSNLNVSLKERTFNDSFKNIMLYVNRIDPRSGQLHNVLIEDSRTKGVNNTVVARSGTLFGEPEKMIYHLRLFDGTINQMDMQNRSSNTVKFDTYDIRLNLKDILATRTPMSKRPDEMTLTDLRSYLQKIKGKDAEYYSALLKYYKKFSIPVACLAMGLLAMPLGIQNRRSKKAFGIGLGLVFFLLYYMLLSLGTAFGENGSYPPVIGMWMPNLILGGFGIFLLVQSARERQISINWLEPVLQRVTKLIVKR